MEIEISPNDTERLELIRNATRVFSELTDIQNKSILVRRLYCLRRVSDIAKNV